MRRGPDDKLNVRSSLAFFAVHLVPFLAIFTGVTRTRGHPRGRHVHDADVLHHRRIPPLLLAQELPPEPRSRSSCSRSAARWPSQKGPLWWAAHHRNHHRFSDTDRDVHSPKRGFWWSHVGWILCDKYNQADTSQIRDFAKYPELRFIDKHDWIGPWTLAVVVLPHRRVERPAHRLLRVDGACSGTSTFTVNSVAHVFGRRAYDTDDTSRNSLLVALATGGEGWHNNHHRYPWAARQGFRWWQIDMTYYVLRALSWVGIVRDLRPVPASVIEEARAAKARRRASDTSPSSR